MKLCVATATNNFNWVKSTHIRSFVTKHFRRLFFELSFHSQYQWVDQLIKQIRNDYSHARSLEGSPFEPSRCIKASFYILENSLKFPTTKGFRREISMKLINNTWQLSLLFPPTLSHLHPLQVEICTAIFAACSGWRWQCKVRLERVN